MLDFMFEQFVVFHDSFLFFHLKCALAMPSCLDMFPFWDFSIFILYQCFLSPQAVTKSPASQTVESTSSVTAVCQLSLSLSCVLVFHNVVCMFKERVE